MHVPALAPAPAHQPWLIFLQRPRRYLTRVKSAIASGNGTEPVRYCVPAGATGSQPRSLPSPQYAPTPTHRTSGGPAGPPTAHWWCPAARSPASRAGCRVSTDRIPRRCWVARRHVSSLLFARPARQVPGMQAARQGDPRRAGRVHTYLGERKYSHRVECAHEGPFPIPSPEVVGSRNWSNSASPARRPSLTLPAMRRPRPAYPDAAWARALRVQIAILWARWHRHTWQAWAGRGLDADRRLPSAHDAAVELPAV